MPNLADSLQRQKFVEKLEACEKSNLLSDWEWSFISNMRENFDSREDALDLGCTPWNPSANQINTLDEVYRRVK